MRLRRIVASHSLLPCTVVLSLIVPGTARALQCGSTYNATMAPNDPTYIAPGDPRNQDMAGGGWNAPLGSAVFIRNGRSPQPLPAIFQALGEQRTHVRLSTGQYGGYNSTSNGNFDIRAQDQNYPINPDSLSRAMMPGASAFSSMAAYIDMFDVQPLTKEYKTYGSQTLGPWNASDLGDPSFGPNLRWCYSLGHHGDDGTLSHGSVYDPIWYHYRCYAFADPNLDVRDAGPDFYFYEVDNSTRYTNSWGFEPMSLTFQLDRIDPALAPGAGAFHDFGELCDGCEPTNMGENIVSWLTHIPSQPWVPNVTQVLFPAVGGAVSPYYFSNFMNSRDTGYGIPNGDGGLVCSTFMSFVQAQRYPSYPTYAHAYTPEITHAAANAAWRVLHDKCVRDGSLVDFSNDVVKAEQMWAPILGPLAWIIIPIIANNQAHNQIENTCTHAANQAVNVFMADDPWDNGSSRFSPWPSGLSAVSISPDWVGGWVAGEDWGTIPGATAWSWDDEHQLTFNSGGPAYVCWD